MKTVILRIENPRPNAAGGKQVFPVTLTIDGQQSVEEIPVDKLRVQHQQLVDDPAVFGGRELGGSDDPDEKGVPGSNADFARWLHELVFVGNLAGSWTSLTGSVADGVRLVLDIEPNDLRKLRWEQMGSNSVFPARHPMCAVVRGRYDARQRVPLRDGPLRILVVVGSEKDDPAVKAEDEVKALRTKLEGRVDEVELKVLERPTRQGPDPEKKFAEVYRKFKPHVFHFIGHGTIEKNGNTRLVFYDELQKTNVHWPLDVVVSELGLHKPAFVFLNACHTRDVQGGRNERTASWSISDTFLNGIKARGVLGMHGAVKGDLAGYLAAELYEQVIAGTDLDVALNLARIEVDRHRNIDSERVWDWTLPYLRVRVSPDQVLGMAPVVSRLKKRAALVKVFRDTPTFVDRAPQRQKFLNSVQSDPARNTNLVLVHGPTEVGKTGLICYCLEAAASRGRVVKYVKLDPENRVDDVGLLQAICEGDAKSLIEKPLPRAAMRRFNQTLNAAFAGADTANATEVDKFPEAAKWTKAGRPRALPKKSRAEDPVGDVFGAFINALEQVPRAARLDLATLLESDDPAAAERARADDRPFLLVIDELSQESVDPGRFKSVVIPSLLRPIAEGIRADLLVVVGVKQEDYRALGLDEFDRTEHHVDLEPFAAVDLVPLATEYFDKKVSLFRGTKTFDQARWLKRITEVQQQYQQDNETWIPDVLHYLFQVTYFSSGRARP